METANIQIKSNGQKHRCVSRGGDVWGRVDPHVAGEGRVLVATGYERQSQKSRWLPGNFTAERNAGNAFPDFS